MAYLINKTNGDPLITVDDGTADITTTSLVLIGRNFPAYGEYLNENFIKLLENFAKSTQPGSAQSLRGQLWYDTSVSPGVLKVYTGTEYVAAGRSIELEQSAATVHYLTMVDSEIGAPALKTAKDKGITIQPSTGNIGINTTVTPLNKLVVNAGSNRARTLPTNTFSGTIAQFHGEDSRPAIITVDAYGGTDPVFAVPGFWMRKSRGTSASPSAVQAGDFLGGFAVGGYGSTAWSSTPRAALWVTASQNWTDTNQGTRLNFYITPNNSNVWLDTLSIEHNGDIRSRGDIIAYDLSDEKLKTNTAKISGALEKVLELDGVTFNWRPEVDGKDATQREAGILAQQVQRVLPEAVRQRLDGNLGVRYEKLIPLLIEAIKDLQQEVVGLKAKLA